MRSAMLYSKALEAAGAGNKAQAAELFRQVVAKFPTYAPAKANLAMVGGYGSTAVPVMSHWSPADSVRPPAIPFSTFRP